MEAGDEILFKVVVELQANVSRVQRFGDLGVGPDPLVQRVTGTAPRSPEIDHDIAAGLLGLSEGACEIVLDPGERLGGARTGAFGGERVVGGAVLGFGDGAI